MESLSAYDADGVLLQKLTVLSARFSEHTKTLVLRTEELRSIEEAEPLREAFFEILPEERVPLEEGTFWIDDLKGMAVVQHEDGAFLGDLADVVPTGAHDVYAVRDGEGKLHYIPATKQFVARVDLEKRELRVTLIDGLWESCM